MRFTLPFTLVSLAISAVNAQSGLPTGLINGLSTTCLGGLSSLLTNSALDSCLSLPTALTLFAGTSNSSDSLLPDLSTYLSSDICPNAACNSTTLTSANSSLSSACQPEISSGTTIITPLTYLFTNYDTIRDAACLQGNNTYCLIDTLTDAQSTTRQNITFEYLLNFNKSSLTTLVGTLAANKTAFCSDCNKALFTTLAPLIESNQTISAELGSAFTQACGNNTLGTIPTTITETAKGNSTSSSGTSSSGSGSSGSPSDGASHSMTISLVAVAGLGALSFAGFILVL